MANEWAEFLDYTGAVTYAAATKSDTAYLGRFTFATLLDFEGMARVLTILARGVLFHRHDGELLTGDPRERLDEDWRLHTNFLLCTRNSPHWWIKTAAAGFIAMSTPSQTLRWTIPSMCEKTPWIRRRS